MRIESGITVAIADPVRIRVRNILHPASNDFIEQPSPFVSSVKPIYIFFEISMKMLFGTFMMNSPQPKQTAGIVVKFMCGYFVPPQKIQVCEYVNLQ
jgi:hypothetical protein